MRDAHENPLMPGDLVLFTKGGGFNGVELCIGMVKKLCRTRVKVAYVEAYERPSSSYQTPVGVGNYKPDKLIKFDSLNKHYRIPELMSV